MLVQSPLSVALFLISPQQEIPRFFGGFPVAGYCRCERAAGPGAAGLLVGPKTLQGAALTAQHLRRLMVLQSHDELIEFPLDSLDFLHLLPQAGRSFIDRIGQVRQGVVAPQHDSLRQVPIPDQFQTFLNPINRPGQFLGQKRGPAPGR